MRLIKVVLAFIKKNAKPNPLGRWGSTTSSNSADFIQMNIKSGSQDYCFGPIELDNSNPFKNDDVVRKDI